MNLESTLYSDFEEVPNNYYTYVFILTAGKMAKAIAHQEEHLQNPKTCIW
jgi:hypothetical protein